jgi:hypothetical protein
MRKYHIRINFASQPYHSRGFDGQGRKTAKTEPKQQFFGNLRLYIGRCMEAIPQICRFAAIFPSRRVSRAIFTKYMKHPFFKVGKRFSGKSAKKPWNAPFFTRPRRAGA